MTILDACTSGRTEDAIALVDKHAAHNYSPLPVVAASAEGAWITDVDGRRYLDCLAAYSAVNFGHRNPEITATAHAQLDTVTHQRGAGFGRHPFRVRGIHDHGCGLTRQWGRGVAVPRVPVG